MSHSPIRLLAIDLDGTLLGPQQKISQRNAAAVAKARAAGVEVCIATGRRHTFAWRVLDALRMPASEIIISSNGTVVRERGGALLHRTQLQREISRELCLAAGEYRDRLVFTFDKVDEAPLAAAHPGSLLIESAARLADILGRWLEENRSDIVEISPIARGLDVELAIQAMLCGGIAQMRNVEASIRASRLGESLEICRTEYVARDLAIVDLLPRGCGKGAALAWLAATRGMQREQVAAIGDNFNDLDMLEFAGTSFVIESGAPELVKMARQQGWRLAPSNEQDGVAVAIHEILAL